MKQAWHIAFTDIKIMVRDKIFFFWTLAFPMLFIFVFGNLFQGGTDPAASKAQLLVLNRDSDQWGAHLIEQLKAPKIDLQLLDKEPEEYTRYLVIPADFSEKIEAKKAQELVFIKADGASVQAAAQVETKIFQGIAKVLTQMILHPDTATFFETEHSFKDLMQLKTQFPENTVKEIPRGFDHVIPGIMVQFIMMMVLIYGGIVVMTDRQRGILTRVLYSSASIPHLWGGKFLARLMMGLIQAAILIVVGKILFTLNLGNWFLSLLNILVFAIAIASLSIFLGSVLNKEDLVVGVSVLLANLFAALAGCWWPIEVVPQTVRTVAMISPAYWAMDVFHQVIFFNKGFADVYINYIVILGFAGVFTFLAIKFFKVKT